MGHSRLDIVKGMAIDNENTSIHHQLISTTPGFIHYTVFYAPVETEPDFTLPENFIEKLCCPTPKDYIQKSEMGVCYNKFLNTIRPHGRMQGFDLNIPAKALTFDVAYQGSKLIGFSYRPTIGLMTKKLTYREADNGLCKNKELKLIHKVVRGNERKYKTPYEPPFEDIVSRLSKFIGKQKFQSDVFENIDCILRRDDQDTHVNKKQFDKIQNLSMEQWSDMFAMRYLSIHECRKINEAKICSMDAVVPTTASRTDINHFNIMTTVETVLNEGINPFPDNTASAVASFRRHILTWQKFGMSA